MRATSYLLAAGVLFAGSLAQATVIVDGVGGDTSVATLQEAVDAVLLSSSETEIEIQTNNLAAGAIIPEGTILPRNLTIKAGNGYDPVIAGTLTVMPDNEDTTVTLQGLTFAPGGDNLDALVAAGNISAYDCVFTGGTAVSCGILTANTSFGTQGRLELTSCTLSGWYALVVGRSVEEFHLTDCVLFTAVNGFQNGIIHFGNQPIHRGSGIGLGDSIPDDGMHAAATTPRNVTLDRCVIHAGRCVSWPAAIGGYPDIYTDFGNTLGTIRATNTVFEGLGSNSILVLGWYDMITHSQSHFFTHCTFRNASVVIDVGAPTTQSAGSHVDADFTNCLFDTANAATAAIGVYVYAISGYLPGTYTLTGDGNAYNVPPYAQAAGYTSQTYTKALEVDVAPGTPINPFETTLQERISGAPEDFVTDTEYHIIASGEGLVKDKAVLLDNPVELDFERELRPGGLLNDVGADEIGGTSTVGGWSIY